MWTRISPATARSGPETAAALMNCGRFPITVSTRGFCAALLGYFGEMLASRIRDTVHGVVGASRHLLWYLDFQTGGTAAHRARAAAQRGA